MIENTRIIWERLDVLEYARKGGNMHIQGKASTSSLSRDQTAVGVIPGISTPPLQNTYFIKVKKEI